MGDRIERLSRKTKTCQVFFFCGIELWSQNSSAQVAARNLPMISAWLPKYFNLSHASLLRIEIFTEDRTCFNNKCVSQWIFQEPTKKEPCFNFLDTLPGVREALNIVGYLQWKSCCTSISDYNHPSMPKVKTLFFTLRGYVLLHTRYSPSQYRSKL